MKKVLLGLVVIAGLMISFVYYTLFVSPVSEMKDFSDKVSSEQQKLDQEAEEIGNLSGKGTLEYLRLLESDIECTIYYAEVSGTYFVSQGNVRGDFLIESTDVGGSILSSIIMDDDNFYAWSDIEGELYGVKIPKEVLTEDAAFDTGPIAMDREVSYVCQTWSEVDKSLFVPAKNIVFKNVDDVSQVNMEYGTIYEE